MAELQTTTRRLFSSRARNTVLTFHIAVSVGLLGDSAGFLAIAIRAAANEDPATVQEMMGVLNMFATMFGIPLSFAALLSGPALGFGTKWGVLRYPWVMAKLLLILSVMLVGGLVIGPALTTTLTGGGSQTTPLIAAAAYDVVALAVATGLGVFKPGKKVALTLNRSSSMLSAGTPEPGRQPFPDTDAGEGDLADWRHSTSTCRSEGFSFDHQEREERS